MERLPVKDCITPGHVDAVLHHLSDIFLVADMLKTACRQTVLPQDFKEDFIWFSAEGLGNFCHSAPNIRSQIRVRSRANLPAIVRHHSSDRKKPILTWMPSHFIGMP